MQGTGGPTGDVRDHLALDDALFRALEQGGATECLRFWESPSPAVVVGAFGRIERDVHLDACVRQGVPVLRRSSGGGTVLLAAGCLNFSLVLSLDARPELRHIERSYDRILGAIVDAFAVPGLQVVGGSDVALGDRKVSGNAQRRGRRTLLHHGTVLYAFNTAPLDTYLRTPARQPRYREGRSHGEFVANLPMPADGIREAIAAAWPLRRVDAGMR